MKKVVLFFCGAAMGVVATIGATQMRLVPGGVDFSPTGVAGSGRPLDRFADAFAQVRARYVDKPGGDSLIDAAIDGMLSRLENSSYVNPQDSPRASSCASDSACPFGDNGLEVTMDNGLLTVVSAVDETPAAKAGLMSRDVIAELDGESAQNLSYPELMGRFSGGADAVRLKIVRPGQHKPIALTLTRGETGAPPVHARVEGGDIGYIRIAQFNASTTETLKKAIADITAATASERLKGYVLDLRNNPGGLAHSAIAVAEAFLDSGEIVSVRGRNAQELKRFDANGADLTGGKPLVLLINGGSAAEAEIVAGALQDNKRATIVGTRSFGKGSATSTIALGQSQGAIRLTTGHYFTPSGRPINANGIKPNVEAPQDIPDDLKRAGQSNRDKQSYIPPAASEDKALNRAFALLRATDAAAAPTPAATPN
jgi:carboxyl-terminal processing protease